MYKQEVPAICEWLENEGPDGLVTVGAFVLCTIQTPLSRVKPQMEDIYLRGYHSSSLWGWKKNGYYHTRMFKHELYDMLLSRSVSREDAFYRVLATPGLGLAKTGFLMQLCGWNTACIDVHNSNIHGVTVGKISPAMKPQAKEKKVLEYLSLCDKLGGSEVLWDSWCEYVAGNRMNKSLPTAEAVSKYHYEAISGE